MPRKHPWLLVVLAFLLLIGAWSALITLAVKHAPESLELPAESTGGH
ncbi:hypothetical protein HNR46_000523 [Haloferula luteola]|uniref:Uncharacterized protein n=1 Tax=Haloferula luteola TaxID=595692 RepID=A0A840V938_9BACT|nr:hypothetical protein [Haloferula luteola]MBB5350299.1 hypothetical protein [Haloferula luteola]